jgi:ubiquinone biosynthesis protein
MEPTLPLADFVGHIIGRAQNIADSARKDATQVARDARALSNSAVTAVDAFRGTAAATPRVARIVATSASVCWLYQMDRARRGAAGLSGGASKSFHSRSAVRIRELCEQLRGGILKLGQLASTRIDLLPSEWVEELGKLRDQVPPLEFSAIADRVAQEIGELESNFSSFDEEAMAAASLAQVHAATTNSGREVAVKVQLPGIERAVEADVTAMTLTANMLSDAFPMADLPTTMAELSRALRLELDYEQEAENQRVFRGYYRDDPRVIVPVVIDELSSSRVLTMEKIHGVSLDRYLENASDEERVKVLETLVDLICEQVLHFGHLHADPHPGNFLVTEDGRIAFLDFGCVANFSKKMRHAYAQVALAAMSGQRDRVGELLLDMGFRTADGDGSGISKYADEILAPFRNPEALTELALDPSKQLKIAIELAREDPIVSVPTEFVLLARVLASLGGLVLAYAPGMNLGAILGRHIARALA